MFPSRPHINGFITFLLAPVQQDLKRLVEAALLSEYCIHCRARRRSVRNMFAAVVMASQSILHRISSKGGKPSGHFLTLSEKTKDLNMASPVTLAVVILCALASGTMALPPCGTTGKQCIAGRSLCIGGTCVCKNPPFIYGDPFFMCYRKAQVAAESRNDPSLTTFNNETLLFPFPCRYLMTHVRQELKDRKKNILGYCEFKIHTFNMRARGKVATFGYDVATKIKYDNRSEVLVSVRKFGTASAGVNTFVKYGVNDFLPDGPWTPSTVTLPIVYKDAPNNIVIKCYEDAANNQLVYEPVHKKVISGFKALHQAGGRWRSSNRDRRVPADLREDSQATVPTTFPEKVLKNQPFKKDPVWLSNDKVVGLAPKFQGGALVSDILKPGLSESESMVDRAFASGAAQNQPLAHPACTNAASVLASCNDMTREKAYKSCFWLLTEPKVVKCIHDNGQDYVDLFVRCVEAWCDDGDCIAVKNLLQSNCGYISGVTKLTEFLSGILCP
ncbi:hypothetical protein PoB_006822300 [Plakobranchus ocellatus]|uniref:VWFD domain-containing protein n=1 Tax=Plakobranchus ocellatus TaxID=259542 RepID=A0AAV4DBY6_9GAST|nr:hypothetical protein PoB_006822300 [Plakobranchus ocellatus]